MAQPVNGMASSRRLVVSSADRPTTYTMSSFDPQESYASLTNFYEVAGLGECPRAALRALLLRQTVWSVIVAVAALLMR